MLLLAAASLLASYAHAGVVRLEQTHASIAYSGTWQTVTGSAVSGGSVAASKTAGAAVTVSFTGTGITWIGYRSRQAGGFARVYLDGTIQTAVGTYSTSPQAQTELFRISGLANAAHTLKIEVTGERQGGDPAGGDDAFVVIDAFVIDDGQSDQIIQESDFNVTFSGGWMEVDDPSVSGGSVRASRNVNASAMVTFNGTGIEWIGYRCPCTAGIAQINLLERGFLAYKHTYSPTREAQKVIYRIEGLPPGQHRLEIYVTGRSVDANQENAWVAVDAFRVLNGPVGGGSTDEAPPVVTMTAPAPQALVTGNVQLAADAQDNTGVLKVLFFAQDNIFLGEDNSPPYAITRDTSTIQSGRSFQLTAQAIDEAGNVMTSQATTVTVQHDDRTRPMVAITSPANGSVVSGTIDFSVAAADDQGLSAVYFLRDTSNQLGYITSPPYARTLNTMLLLDGNHTLQARAVDNAGNFAVSSPVTITVDNSVQPGMVRVDDDDPAITYSGAWSLQGGVDAYGTPLFHWGSAAMAETRGASATFTFVGTGVRLISYSCATFCGDATVSIDNGPPQAVSIRGSGDFGEPENLARVVYTSPTLANGTHTITVTVAIDHPSGQGRVYVDGFEVLKAR